MTKMTVSTQDSTPHVKCVLRESAGEVHLDVHCDGEVQTILRIGPQGAKIMLVQPRLSKLLDRFWMRDPGYPEVKKS